MLVEAKKTKNDDETMISDSISDYDIQAFVDNELNKDDRERVRAFIERNREAKERYEELIDQKSILQTWSKDHLH